MRLGVPQGGSGYPRRCGFRNRYISVWGHMLGTSTGQFFCTHTGKKRVDRKYGKAGKKNPRAEAVGRVDAKDLWGGL